VGQVRDYRTIDYRNHIWLLHVPYSEWCPSGAWVWPDHHSWWQVTFSWPSKGIRGTLHHPYCPGGSGQRLQDYWLQEPILVAGTNFGCCIFLIGNGVSILIGSHQSTIVDCCSSRWQHKGVRGTLHVNLCNYNYIWLRYDHCSEWSWSEDWVTPEHHSGLQEPFRPVVPHDAIRGTNNQWVMREL
jgi:hypothetical protein